MSLIELIKKDNEARKIFGKAELIIIEKQLLGINLTQSEKNRLSRDIRKKLEFIKKISEYKDEFRLKKGSETIKEIENAKEAIIDSEYFPRIKRIILFGSFLAKQMTFRSDIDIAVEFDRIDEKNAVQFRLKMARYIKGQFDIQVYNVLPEKIKKEVDEKGKVLWKRG